MDLLEIPIQSWSLTGTNEGSGSISGSIASVEAGLSTIFKGTIGLSGGDIGFSGGMRECLAARRIGILERVATRVDVIEARWK